MEKTNLYIFNTIISLTITLFALNLNAQTIITVEGQILIPDHPAYHDDRETENDHVHNSNYEPLTFSIPVSSLPNQIDTAFGLEKVNLSIKHSRISDIKVELFSPDGTVIWITNRNGKMGKTTAMQRFLNAVLMALFPLQ